MAIKKSIKLCECGCGTVIPLKNRPGRLPRRFVHGHNRSRTTHGMSRTPTIYSWQDMLKRCFNKTNSRWHTHGARGITVCRRWLKFENFLEDMGIKPARMTIERIDNSGDYKPSNCRWATRFEQASNRRNNRKIILRDGRVMSMANAARELGVAYHHLNNRARHIKKSPIHIDDLPTPKNRTRRMVVI